MRHSSGQYGSCQMGCLGEFFKREQTQQAPMLWLHPSLSSCLEHGWDVGNGTTTLQWGQQRQEWDLRDKVAELKGRTRLDPSQNHEDATWALDTQLHTFCYRGRMMHLIQVQPLFGQVFQSSCLNTNLSWYTEHEAIWTPTTNCFLITQLNKNLSDMWLCSICIMLWRPQHFVIFQKYHMMTSWKLHHSNKRKSWKQLSKSHHLQKTVIKWFLFPRFPSRSCPNTQILSEFYS